MTGPHPGDAEAAALSFLEPPGAVRDWRMVVLFETAARAGITGALPGSPLEVAERLNLDAHAARVVLEALAAWNVVEGGDEGRFRPGTNWPGPEGAAVLVHHARAIRGWSTTLDDRLAGVGPEEGRGPPDLGRWLDALAVHARQGAGEVADVCIEAAPGARRALDLGGGHGEYGLELARRGLAVTMQDRPEVIELARRRGTLAGADVTLFAGDFFETLPEGPFDVVLCAGVSATFDGPSNATLFRRLAGIIPEGGVVAVRSHVRGHGSTAALFAVQMLMGGRGGDTHGLDEYRAWFGDAGFGRVEVRDGASGDQAIVLARR